MQVSIDFSREDAQAKAQAMTALFMQSQQSRPASTTSLCPESAEAACTAQPPAEGFCAPSGQMMRPAATGLFMKQGVQAVCCAFHAQAKVQPKRGEEFARWTLDSVTPVSPHSAVYHFTSADGTRYGAYSTRDFVSHHETAISFAITTGAATAIVDGISKLETRMAATAARAMG